MRVRSIVTVTAVMALLGALAVTPAVAAPSGPPDYGVMEPSGLADKGCPWPTEHNDDPMHADAQKCLPQSIPWSETTHDGVTSSGVRIITDSLVGTAALPDATGQVTFRCQSRVGLQYKVTAQGLTPGETYHVSPIQFGSVDPVHLGSFAADPNGNGILNGTLHLPKGGYGFAFMVFDSSGAPVLVMDPADPVVGIAVL